eukprot:TRINITY_DN65493_c0_g1_i1.p1 TRINITY_DN65493_c0_g1~~TRINITY_DN65493_c0_g1_i1.p1  ORF type:complete len:511 (+),score=158.64 TRINITY_DN65493_c0_g1_i1:75-1535(+)
MAVWATSRWVPPESEAPSSRTPDLRGFRPQFCGEAMPTAPPPPTHPPMPLTPRPPSRAPPPGRLVASSEESPALPLVRPGTRACVSRSARSTLGCSSVPGTTPDSQQQQQSGAFTPFAPLAPRQANARGELRRAVLETDEWAQITKQDVAAFHSEEEQRASERRRRQQAQRQALDEQLRQRAARRREQEEERRGDLKEANRNAAEWQTEQRQRRQRVRAGLQQQQRDRDKQIAERDRLRQEAAQQEATADSEVQRRVREKEQQEAQLIEQRKARLRELAARNAEFNHKQRQLRVAAQQEDAARDKALAAEQDGLHQRAADRRAEVRKKVEAAYERTEKFSRHAAAVAARHSRGRSSSPCVQGSGSDNGVICRTEEQEERERELRRYGQLCMRQVLERQLQEQRLRRQDEAAEAVRTREQAELDARRAQALQRAERQLRRRRELAVVQTLAEQVAARQNSQLGTMTPCERAMNRGLLYPSPAARSTR